ncbi:cupredoxin domain-containing protein [Candidatus Woesearchaeota archaeon]|nr:cupredoxin domain-containing protein [Candidatus Woesearchaeota archaeon]
MRWVLVILLLLLVACSSPTKVSITGTPIVQIEKAIPEKTDGYLLLLLNPIENGELVIRNVQIHDGTNWIKISDSIKKNKEKPVVLAQGTVPFKEYQYVKFTIDSAKFEGKAASLNFPQIVLPLKFNLTKDFTVLSFDLLKGESLKTKEDKLMFSPVFRIETQNAIDVQVETDNTVKTFDKQILNTIKLGMNGKGDFTTGNEVVPEKPKTSALLEDNPKEMQIDYSKYLENKGKNPELPEIKISIYENRLNPSVIELKRNNNVTLVFENKWDKILGLSLVGLNGNLLIKPGESFNYELHPKEESNYNINCMYPCWGREGSNLGIIKVEKEKVIPRYD